MESFIVLWVEKGNNQMQTPYPHLLPGQKMVTWPHGEVLSVKTQAYKEYLVFSYLQH